MKNLIWIVIAAVVAAGAYMVFTGKSVNDVVDSISTESVEIPEELDSAADAVGDAATGTADAVEDAVEEAVDAVTQPAEEAEEAADTAMEAVEDATDDAADTAVEATEEATDTAAEMSEEATEDPAATAAETLSVDGFNMEKVSGMIDGSDLGDLKKTMLKGALKQAQDNPELLKAALEQVKTALGL